MWVLVAEREILSALQLARVVEQAGHSVVGPARSSGEAIMLARGAPPEFALIGVDLEQRGVGIRLARQLVSEFCAPVVFIASPDAPALEHRSRELVLIRTPLSAAALATMARHIREAAGSRRTVGMPAPDCNRSAERAPDPSNA